MPSDKTISVHLHHVEIPLSLPRADKVRIAF
jgi:hypothetical protein